MKMRMMEIVSGQAVHSDSSMSGVKCSSPGTVSLVQVDRSSVHDPATKTVQLLVPSLYHSESFQF